MRIELKFFHFLLLISICSFLSCKGQKTFGENYLQLINTISLPGVKGRIDHLDINLKDQIVYVAALGSNSVITVSLTNGKVLHTITGLDEPQGIIYIPQHHEIFITNGGNGDCYFYNAETFEKIATIHLSSDADNARYDSADRKIYVGYGNGGIAIIDADNHTHTGDVKLPAHPEGFQIDKKNNLLYVNLPARGMVGVIDLKQLTLINKWIRKTPSANFPMALGNAASLLFIGYRHPAKLVVIDTRSGKQVSINDMSNDADDLFYDEPTKRLYASGGGEYTMSGHINIFQYEDSNTCKQIANIPTRNGSRTCLLVPELNLFLLPERSGFNHSAELLVYKIQK